MKTSHQNEKPRRWKLGTSARRLELQRVLLKISVLQDNCKHFVFLCLCGKIKLPPEIPSIALSTDHTRNYNYAVSDQQISVTL